MNLTPFVELSARCAQVPAQSLLAPAGSFVGIRWTIAGCAEYGYSPFNPLWDLRSIPHL